MLPTAEKEKLKSILLKNNIKELPEPRLTKIKAITEEDEDQEEDDEELHHSEEEKIEEILDTLVKEKKCKTTFKKIVGNTYLYGNQRITAKLEGEEVKVLYGNTFAMHLEQLEQLKNDIDLNEKNNIIEQVNKNKERSSKEINYFLFLKRYIIYFPPWFKF